VLSRTGPEAESRNCQRKADDPNNAAGSDSQGRRRAERVGHRYEAQWRKTEAEGAGEGDNPVTFIGVCCASELKRGEGQIC
jgi:hypothetical protein